MTVPHAALSERDLQHLENLYAEGLDPEEIAKEFGLSKRQFESLCQRDSRIPQAIKNGQERYAIMSDQERRRRLKLEDQKFLPMPKDIEIIKELATLGWAELKIANDFGVGPRCWNEAKRKYPQLAEALKVGYANSGGRRIQNSIDAWMPKQEDLLKIQELAAQGMTAEVISVEMKLPVGTIRKKFETVPEVREAYEAGWALAEFKVAKPLFESAKNGQINAGIYFLKSRRSKEWSDRPLTAAERNQDLKGLTVKKFASPPLLNLKDISKEGERLKKMKEKREKKKASE